MSINLYSALMNYRKKQQYLKKVFGSEYYTYHFEDVLNKYGKVTEKELYKMKVMFFKSIKLIWCLQDLMENMLVEIY